MAYKQAVRAIVINGQSVLAIRRDNFGLKYYTLVGGGVDVGEDLETALRRELREETGLEVGTVREVFTENGGDLYGMQHVFLCEYKGGEPVLAPNSEEALISAMGKNIYEPVWLPLDQMTQVQFRSTSVRDALLAGVHAGFPATPKVLDFATEA
jgi:ADP-ribose pyrophosphatase YjhB (NUDIX family)